MGSTLEHGIYLPSEGEKNCYQGLASNWNKVDGALGDIAELKQSIESKFTKEIVTELPTEDINPYCIYMILKTDPETDNVYDEWVYINNAWEYLGNTKVDMTQYYTKQEVNQLPAVASGVTATKVGNYDAHIANGDIHVTASDKAKWDTVVLPIGSYIQFAGSQAPAGFLVCNGGAISRTTYSALFAVIGTTYGRGDGSTTFNLPNLTDRFLQGSTTSGTVKDAGLPNITGYFNYNCTGTGKDVTTTGAISLTVAVINTRTPGSGNVPLYVNDYHFNASNSNSIYNNSTTVQPPALTCLICIKY